jgi:acyl-coenzyme A thioesterase 9
MIVRRPVPVAPLVVETEEERQLFRKGEEKYVSKKALRNRSLLQQSPNDEESELIHAMWTTEVSYNGMSVLTIFDPSPFSLSSLCSE